MMDPPCKRLKIEGDKLIDRLSDVPINVKHQIQEKLPIDEAARMSVLSKSWTYVWVSIPKLSFSLKFCQSKPLPTLIHIISTILLQHDGAIKTFLLNVSSIPHSHHYVVDQWMFLLSKNGLLELNLQNMNNHPYKLPSYMFSLGLQELYLSNCIIRPPSTFRGFHKLKRLILHEAPLELDDVVASYLWMPNLESLLVKTCVGVSHLKISAPNLLLLSVFTNTAKSFELDQFINCTKLKTVALANQNQKVNKAMNLNYILNSWCNVSHLVLDSYHLKSFAFGIQAACLNNLRVLNPLYFDFDDENQILSLLRMLRSSPNLEDLLFTCTKKKKKGAMELVDVNHVEHPAYTTQGFRLNKLKILKIENLHGLRTELLFVRFILASAPLLLKIILTVNADDKSQCLKITKELMGFPRASRELEIICEPSKPAKKLIPL